MSTREFLLDKARSKFGKYAKGSREVYEIWKSVLAPGSVTDSQVVQISKALDWCGAFALCCLHESNLITAEHWKLGSGFVLRVLGAKSATKVPIPGDIGIREGPPEHRVYHHFIVAQWNGPGDWISLDGNTPYCEEKHHALLDPTITFYSIDSILPTMPEPGFSKDDPYAVPGVQEG